MTTLEKVLLALVVAVVIVVLTLLVFTKLSEGEPQPTGLYDGIPIDATLLEMDKAALREAYHQRLLHLFNIWLQGGAQSDKEIKAGLILARRAYNQAAQQISVREQELLKQDAEKHGGIK
jgi:hypothetical protein